MNTATLSKATVTENGIVTGLPDNFNQLSVKKQKQLVVEAFRDNLISLNDTLQQAEQIQAESKLLSKRIKLSKEGKQLAQMKADVKQLSKASDTLRAMRMGMLHITKKLGFDITAELKKMKLIDNE